MKLPQPGLVVRYAFLWRREFDAGREEGRKDRPCAVVLTTRESSGGVRVYVLPVTHAPPSDPSLAIEIPAQVKQHLGLDDAASWIVLEEINDFLWPGYDLRAVPGTRPVRMDYGFLPPRFFDRVRAAFLDLARERRVKRVARE